MEYKDVATIPVICNNADADKSLLDSLKDKFIFINTKNKDKENPLHTTSTYKITNIVYEDKDIIGLVGNSNFISLPIERVFELIRYGRVSETIHTFDDTYISNYYLVA